MWLAVEERSALYRFLAGIFNTVPTKEFAGDFINGLKTWQEFGNQVSRQTAKLTEPMSLISEYLHRNKDNPEDCALELGIDRTRLTGGISKDYGPPPPYESVYRDGEILMGPSTKLVRRHYQRSDIYHGWKLAENPPDYLGLELEYMFFLCRAQSAAAGEEDKQKIKSCRRHFLEEHLGKWAPAYSGQIRRWAGTEFYQGIGLLLEQLIAGDLKHRK
ncbi:MAG: TorD/DmsD family molecular chaperone [Peptococcaceae bacterium]